MNIDFQVPVSVHRLAFILVQNCLQVHWEGIFLLGNLKDTHFPSTVEF